MKLQNGFESSDRFSKKRARIFCDDLLAMSNSSRSGRDVKCFRRPSMNESRSLATEEEEHQQISVVMDEGQSSRLSLREELMLIESLVKLSRNCWSPVLRAHSRELANYARILRRQARSSLDIHEY